MLEKTITYTDLKGRSVTETFHFQIKADELVKFSFGVRGGLDAAIRRAIRDDSGREIMDLFEELISGSYGVPSDDEKSFVKSKERTQWFLGTRAYTSLFMDLVTDADKAAEFTKAVIPSEEVLDETAAKFQRMIDRASSDETSKTFDSYTRDELLEMSKEQFDALVGTDISKMTKEQLTVLYQRKTSGK